MLDLEMVYDTYEIFKFEIEEKPEHGYEIKELSEDEMKYAN